MPKHSAGRHSRAGRRDQAPIEPVEERRAPRTERLRRRQRRSLLVRVAAGIVTGALVAVAIAGNPFAARDGGEGSGGSVQGGVRASRPEPITTLVFGTREESRGSEGEALWLMIFNHDPRDDEGAAVHIPAHTAAEVPGRGLTALNSAYTSGGIPLLLVTLENLLGIEVDRYLELSDRDARVLFQATGRLTVDIPDEVRVPVGKKHVRLIFGEGSQELGARSLVRLLFTRGTNVDDVDFGSRQLAFWDALFNRFDNEPQLLGSAIVKAGPALAESDAKPEEHARFFASLADLPRVALTITSLPVGTVAAGDDELYSANVEAIQEFVAANISETRPARDEVRVQILNGNGVPGIGQKVAERLVGEGYRVILSGNARRLDYRRTLIVTYDGSEEGQALAERAKRLLRVGQIQISAQQQGIVDLTIVVGEDFLSTL